MPRSVPRSRHGTGGFGDRERRRSGAARGDRQGAQPQPQARPAGTDRAAVGGPAGGGGGGQARRREPARGLALAAPLRRGGCDRPVAGQDEAARDTAVAGRDDGAGGGDDLRRAARRSHPLDRPGDGQRGRHLAQFGAADLGRARPPAAPDPNLRTLERPSVCREAPGHRWAVRRAAGAQPGAVGRRKEPDSGTRSHPARAAAQARQSRHLDARRQAPRHHHPVRRAQRPRRPGDRALHGAPPPPRVHPLPQRDRARGTGRQGGRFSHGA